MMSLQELLLWVLGGGAAVLTYWLMERVPFLQKVAPAWKRIVSFALAGVLGCAAFGIAVLLGYQADPGTTLGWLEMLVIIVSQIIHGMTQLPKTASTSA